MQEEMNESKKLADGWEKLCYFSFIDVFQYFIMYKL
jgi:hypothetical protein